ncbi:HlyD family secretion protein [Oceanicella sp. SM1341]|uniref:HlyD family secretion protein n=1 Tax=Oceanicella sp. SM1341 TaxID=1548889 RepID=UPI000E4EE0B7|nr:HlyD family secretion protein [Oceanicella sp. SM1341]
MPSLTLKLALAGAAVLVVAAGVRLNRPESAADVQETEDAYLISDYTNVAPRVAGTIASVLVRENQRVEAGDLLATIDDRDLRLAVRSAEAGLATIGSQIAQQQALIREAEASLEAISADVSLAESDAGRARKLVSRAISQRALDEAETGLAIATARRDGAAAALEAARGLLRVYAGQKAATEAALDTARLQLSYAQITAPVSGTIGQQSLRVGQYVSVGTTAMAIVPLDKIYVTANFRETQLARVRAGQPVELTVDALPALHFAGRVESIGAASNVSYSAIAPANATGNFTKVAQRLPVRIALAPGQEGMERMRVGMSVVPRIHVDDRKEPVR